MIKKFKDQRAVYDSIIDSLNSLIRANKFLSKTWHTNYNIYFNKKEQLKQKNLNNSLDENEFIKVLHDAQYSHLIDLGVDRNTFLHKQQEYALAIEAIDQEDRNIELARLEEYALAIEATNLNKN